MLVNTNVIISIAAFGVCLFVYLFICFVSIPWFRFISFRLFYSVCICCFLLFGCFVSFVIVKKTRRVKFPEFWMTRH
jgi:hypothetical protein